MKYYLFTLTLIYSLFSSAQLVIQDDFEGNGTINSWFGDDCVLDSSFSNPYIEGINTSDTYILKEKVFLVEISILSLDSNLIFA